MEDIKNLLMNEDLLPVILDWGFKLLLAIIIYVVGKWIARLISRSFSKLMKAREVDPTLVAFLYNIVYAILLTAVILASLDTLGVPVTSLLAVVGAAGLAVGLALKDSLGNFAAGVMLVFFRPFTKDDFVEVGGVSGKVEEVGIFNTTLATPDNKQVIIPNAQITATTITNFTAKAVRRVDLVIGVDYTDNLKTARDVLERVCNEHPKILKEPALNIFVLNLGDSSVDFAVRPWAKTEDYWVVWGDILEQAKAELEAAGCSIPFPQRDVHLYQTAES